MSRTELTGEGRVYLKNGKPIKFTAIDASTNNEVECNAVPTRKAKLMQMFGLRKYSNELESGIQSAPEHTTSTPEEVYKNVSLECGLCAHLDPALLELGTLFCRLSQKIIKTSQS